MKQELVDPDLVIATTAAMPDWLVPAMWVIGILLPAVGILSIVLFNVIHQRLQSLGHEDREIRQRIDRVYMMVLEIQKDLNRNSKD